MRNLKRALSLGLASAMVLGTMAFSASAATNTDITPNVVTTAFGDNDSINIDNMNSVYIAEYIGLMNGYEDGTFKPETTVTRIQMAVICVNMLHGIDFAQENYDNDTGITHFSDVADWAKSYASAAHSAGIVTGRDATTFDPDSPVTAAEALLMIQKTLGYFQDPAEFGTNWKDATTRKADSLGLYKTGTYSQDTALTREQVAAIAVYALTDCVAVSYNDSSKTYHNASSGYSINNLPQNEIVEDTLGYNNFNKLKVEDSIDSFSRPTELWSMAGREIANFVVDVHTDSTGADMEYTYSKTKKELATELKSYTSAETHEFGIFVDGMEYSEWMYAYGHTKEKLPATTDIEGFFAVMDTQNDGDFLPSNNGVLTQVFVTDEVKYVDGQGNEQGHKGKVYVTCINTYLGEVRDVLDHETGEYTTTVAFFGEVLRNSKGEPTGLELPDMNMVEGLDGEFEVDDIVIVQASAFGRTANGYDAGISSDMTLVTVNTPETVTGIVTESTLTADYVGGLSLKIDDVAFEYSIGSRGEIVYENEMTPSTGTELTAYFDANVGPDGTSYILGYEAVETAPQYLYVEESDGDGWTFLDGSTCRVTFADGAEKVIQISHIDGEAVNNQNYSMIPNGNRFYDDDKNWVSANENFYTNEDGEIDFSQIENRVFGWEYYADSDTYNITTTIQDPFYYDSTESDLGVSEGGLLASSVLGYGEDVTPENERYLNYGTLEFEDDEDGLTNNGSPIKDTMAIFTSVYMPGQKVVGGEVPGLDNTNKVAIYDEETDDFLGYRNIGYDDVVSYYKNDTGKHSVTGNQTFWNFALTSSNNVAFALQNPASDELEFVGKTVEAKDDGDDTYAVDDNHDAILETGFIPESITIKDLADDGIEYDHIFTVNSNTVIVDVVNNNIWQGTSDSEFEDLTDGTLNMQVVFGHDGVATVIFINNGVADPVGEGEYFILMDDTCREYIEDSVTYFEYNVYIDGVATTIISKNKEVAVTNENDHIYAGENKLKDLNVNTLYRISEVDNDGFVRTVDYKYDYSPLGLVTYKAAEQETYYVAPGDSSTDDYKAGEEYTLGGEVPHDVYNNLWSVATTASGGLLKLRHDDEFADKTGKNYDKGYFDNDEIPGEDVFVYDDSTVFVYLSANKDGDFVSARPASVDDIREYSTNSVAHTWVDVVVASGNAGVNPYAELVVIINPYGNDGYDDSVSDTLTDGEFVLSDWADDGSGSMGTPYTGLEITYSLSDLSDISESTLITNVMDAVKKGYGYPTSDKTVSLGITGNVLLFYIEDENGNKTYFKVDIRDSEDDGDLVKDAAYVPVTNEDLFILATTLGFFAEPSQGEMDDLLSAAGKTQTHADITYDLTVDEAFKMGILVDGFVLGGSTEWVMIGQDNTKNVYMTAAKFGDLTMTQLLALIADDSTGNANQIKANLVRMTVDLNTLEKDLDYDEDFTLTVSYGAGSPISDVAYIVGTGNIKTYYAEKVENTDFDVTLNLVVDKIDAFPGDPATITFNNGKGNLDYTTISTNATLSESVWTLTAPEDAGEKIANNGTDALVMTYAQDKTATFTYKESVAPEAPLTINGEEAGKFSRYATVKDYWDATGHTGWLIVNDKVYTTAGAGAGDDLFVDKTEEDGGGSEIWNPTETKQIKLPAGVTADGETSADSGVIEEGESWYDNGTNAASAGNANYVYVTRDAKTTLSLAFANTEGNDAKYAQALIVKGDGVATASEVLTQGAATLTGAALGRLGTTTEYNFAYKVSFTNETDAETDSTAENAVVSITHGSGPVASGSYVEIGEKLDIVGTCGNTNPTYIHVGYGGRSAVDAQTTGETTGFEALPAPVAGNNSDVAASATWSVGYASSVMNGAYDAGGIVFTQET